MAQIRITFKNDLKTTAIPRAVMLGEQGFRALYAMERTLQDAFEYSQYIVPVDTHSLQNSGIVESDFQSDEWVGTITYGGASPGAEHDPVTYAQYVEAYYGDGNWMKITQETFEPDFLEAMEEAWGLF